MRDRVRRFEVHEVGEGLCDGVDVGRRDEAARLGFRVQGDLPDGVRTSAPQKLLAVRKPEVAERGVELAASARAYDLVRGISATRSVKCMRYMNYVDESGERRYGLSAGRRREHLAIPSRIGMFERLGDMRSCSQARAEPRANLADASDGIGDEVLWRRDHAGDALCSSAKPPLPAHARCGQAEHLQPVGVIGLREPAPRAYVVPACNPGLS